MIGPIKLSEIDELVPMPISTVRLSSLMNNPDTSLSEIARVVELDQALTANVLRLANSALSGSRASIDTVKNAIVRIGTARILGLAIARQIAGEMSRPCAGYDLVEYELWRHSVAAALAADNLKRFTSGSVPAAAFTAALLHDIGKLLLSRHIDRKVLEQIREMINKERFTYLEAERKVLGTDHAEVGAAIARHWKFPEKLAVAIEKHHNVDEDPDPLLDAVHIANAVAKLIGVGLGSEQMNMEISSDAYQRLGIRDTGLESLCVKVKFELAEAEELYGSKKNGT